jgi:hypothetical protein
VRYSGTFLYGNGSHSNRQTVTPDRAIAHTSTGLSAGLASGEAAGLSTGLASGEAAGLSTGLASGEAAGLSAGTLAAPMKSKDMSVTQCRGLEWPTNITYPIRLFSHTGAGQWGALLQLEGRLVAKYRTRIRDWPWLTLRT